MYRFSQLWITFVTFLWSISVVSANRASFSSKNSVVCAGIYSKKDWGGSYIPHIGIQLNRYNDEKYDKKNNPDGKTDEDIHLSYVIFEYKDLSNVGVQLENGHYYICDDYMIRLKKCEDSQKGKFIVNSDVKPNNTIYASQLTHLGPAHINYTISNTGYYCVSLFSSSYKEFEGAINFQNAFGDLSGSEIPKLLAYGILTLCYAIVLALFGFQFFKKRNKHQILPLQRYLLAMLGFLTFDTLVVWSYYDLVNRTHTSSTFGTVYMFFLSTLNAIKISLSFYLILLISLGYGVVSLKLKKGVMLKVKILAGLHFVASMFYLIATYYTGGSIGTTATDEDFEGSTFGGILFLLCLIPISITLTIYYVAILVSIKKTTTQLHQQRQVIKLKLYENLFRIIFISIVLTAGGFVLSSFVYMSMNSTDMVESYWKSAYFIFDFWPSVVFFIVFIGISWLWRPTETSYMLAVSQQLGQDENVEGEGYQQGTEFELDDLSLLSHSDTERDAQRDDDSFELGGDSHPGASQPTAPPSYHEADEKNHVKNTKGKPDDSLFEFGGDSDDETQAEDDRLKNS